MIQEQVRLPLKVAFGVVIQGIRIRFARSLITLMGVALGTAFLVANLAAQTITTALREEEDLRSEVKRMANFLEAEIGPSEGRTIGVIQTGPLEKDELRLVQYLLEQEVKSLDWHAAAGQSAFSFDDFRIQTSTDLNNAGTGASCLLILGDGPLPAPLADPAAFAKLFEGAEGRVLAMTRTFEGLATPPNVVIANLAREYTPEELAKAAEEKTRAVFRRNWIVVISMVVTVAGIANAMLMSVTERFREIGTMKCLGALSSFVRWIFFFESSFLGALGGVAGGVLGIVFSLTLYGFTYGYSAVLASVDWPILTVYLALSVVVGVVLSVIAAIYPASVAAAMVPANALRTDV